MHPSPTICTHTQLSNPKITNHNVLSKKLKVQKGFTKVGNKIIWKKRVRISQHLRNLRARSTHQVGKSSPLCLAKNSSTKSLVRESRPCDSNCSILISWRLRLLALITGLELLKIDGKAHGFQYFLHAH